MKIQIVNEHDEIIGSKERSLVDYKNDIYRVSALWITNTRGEALIAQRKFTKDKDPGKWGPAVAGTLEESETYESNIYKEAEEEVGLTGVSFDPGPKRRRNDPRNYFTQWFIAELDWPIEQFKIQEDEVEQVAWIKKDELARDVRENPDKYIPSMPDIIELFVDKK